MKKLLERFKIYRIIRAWLNFRKIRREWKGTKGVSPTSSAVLTHVVEAGAKLLTGFIYREIYSVHDRSLVGLILSRTAAMLTNEPGLTKMQILYFLLSPPHIPEEFVNEMFEKKLTPMEASIVMQFADNVVKDKHWIDGKPVTDQDIKRLKQIAAGKLPRGYEISKVRLSNKKNTTEKKNATPSKDEVKASEQKKSQE